MMIMLLLDMVCMRMVDNKCGSGVVTVPYINVLQKCVFVIYCSYSIS